MTRHTHIFHREPRAELPIAARGDGVYIIDTEGRHYLDASGGAAVSCLGHSHPAVTSAIECQIKKLPFAHSAFFTNDSSERLAELLIDKAPLGINRVYFVSGGSEAMETALKVARQYYLERKQPQRCKFIARRQSYHGNTLGALSVSGNTQRRKEFEPLLMDTSHIAPCYAYRDQRPDETLENYGLRVTNELESQIQELGSENVIGFIAEPVVGATAGGLVAPPGYFKRIRKICNDYDILLTLDEVMCGMGRTGTLYACEQEGISPDIVTIAKGLAGGYQPLGAMLCSATIYDTIHRGSGRFQHGHTYVGHATTCAAGIAVQSTIQDTHLLENVISMGRRLHTGLQRRFAQHPHVGDIRGRGLLWGIELVADRSTKEPLAPPFRLHSVVKRHAMALGLICYPSGGTIDGLRGDHVLLAPPYIINSAKIDKIITLLGHAIDLACAELELTSSRNSGVHLTLSHPEKTCKM